MEERWGFTPLASPPEGVAEDAAPILKGVEVQLPFTFSPAEARQIREDAKKATIRKTAR